MLKTKSDGETLVSGIRLSTRFRGEKRKLATFFSYVFRQEAIYLLPYLITYVNVREIVNFESFNRTGIMYGH